MPHNSQPAPTTAPCATPILLAMTIPPVRGAQDGAQDADGSPSALKITPTDVSQFVRFEMCERFLRFQLHSRNVAYRFMEGFGLRAQTLSPILSRSGAAFEARLDGALQQRARQASDQASGEPGQPAFEAMRDFSLTGEWEFSDRMPESEVENLGSGEEAVQFGARSHSGDRRRKPDNGAVLDFARQLRPGRTLWLLQPRLVVALHGWELRGDVDVLRLRKAAGGRLQVLVADMKASPRPQVDQKLQVAFYHEMLSELFQQARIEIEPIQCGVLYRGPLQLSSITDAQERRALEAHRALALREFGALLPGEDGSGGAYFDAMEDRDSFFLSAREMVFNEDSFARQAALKPFEEVAWHLSHKCDGCPFSQWCLQSASRDDDLSLLPHLDPDLKIALRARGVRTVTELSQLKDLKPDDAIRAATAADASTCSSDLGPAPVWEDEAVEVGVQAWNELEVAPGSGDIVRRLASTRGVGARLDEMILRAHALMHKRRRSFSEIRAKKRLFRRGHPSLPFSSAEVNPNLVTLYLDAQYDFLNGRLYALSALVVAHEGGVERASRAVVQLSSGPPTSAEIERELLENWINETLRAVVELAAPTEQGDEQGELKAPLHLVFFEAREQKELLEALGRHFESIRAATPLYDFVTQIGSFDSSLASFLDQEMRERRNYPVTCPSLYEVSSYLRFDWDAPAPFRQLFHERLFDGGGYLETLDDGPLWVQKRARYGSSIPLEYAHAAWGLLPSPELPSAARNDPWQPFRAVNREVWLAFAHRRLEAMRHVARDFQGNKLTSKTLFSLPDLDQPPAQEPGLADALEEFLILERHASLGTWKAARHAPPERRALAGDSLVCKYLEEDQVPEVREQNRLNARIEARQQEWREANPDKKQLPRGFSASLGLGAVDHELKLRLRLQAGRSGVSVGELLALSGFSEGSRAIVAPRYSVDGRLPAAERKPYQTTVKQLLYGMRGDLQRIEVDERGEEAWLHLQLTARGGTDRQGFTFSGRLAALRHGEMLSVEEEVSDHVGSHAIKTLRLLRSLKAPNTLLDRLQNPAQPPISWSPASRAAQQKFMAGLQVLALTDPALEMERSKQDFIAGFGDAPFLLVQGPPGTGKTYASSWALWARLQAAIADGSPLRILVSCKTHSAIDVLLRGLQKARERLRQAQREQPEVFAKYFDARLLEIPLLRFEPKDPLRWEQEPSNKELLLLLDKNNISELSREQARADRYLERLDFCVLGATPNACYKMAAQTGKPDEGALFGHGWFGMLVVDEASQMSLPEGVMASLALEPGAPILIVGDPRQMPPIVAHDWRNETRRTFARFKAFVSLYDAVSALDQAPELPLQDDVTRESQVQPKAAEAPLQDDVTRESQAEPKAVEAQVLEGLAVRPGVSASEGGAFEVPRIRFEESFRLHRDMAEFLRREIYHRDGIGYHSRRTQTLQPPQVESDDPLVRAALNPLHPLVVIVHGEEGSVLSNEFEHRLATPILRALAGVEGHGLDARAGLGVVVPHRAQRALMRDAEWNVDTVERFQGDEREAMLFCATESERGHLLRAGGFLFDPRRLNVALSRAKRKMILIASRQVFTGFFADEETFANAMLWKNLLRHTCSVELLKGELDGVPFEVRGNDPNWARQL